MLISVEPVFYPFVIKASKCSGNCNNINDPYAKMCALDVATSLNVKVFNLMSRTNETRHIEWHETCKCKCRLDTGTCNNKQRWDNDKCRCECKELMDKGVCYKGFFFLSGFSFTNIHESGLQGKGEGIYLTPHYHLHPLHGHLGISRAITAESSRLHMASSRTQTGSLLFPSTSL